MGSVSYTHLDVYKRQILNTLREQEVIELALNNLKNPRFKKPLEEFFKGLLKVSKEMQV